MRQHTARLEHATTLMAKLGAMSEDELIAMCGDSARDGDDRLRACHALAVVMGRRAIPVLLSLASEKNGTGVCAAVHGLMCIGSRRATRTLMEIVRYSDVSANRVAALFALGRLGDPRAERLICGVLISDPSDQMKLLAAEALAFVHRGRRTVRCIMRVLNDVPPHVRWSALTTLSEIRHVADSDLDVIRQYLTDETVIPGLPADEAKISYAANLVFQHARKL